MPDGLLSRFQFGSSRQECRIKERIVIKSRVTSKLHLQYISIELFYRSYYEKSETRQSFTFCVDKPLAKRYILVTVTFSASGPL